MSPAQDDSTSMQALVAAWRWGYEKGHEEALGACICPARHLSSAEITSRAQRRANLHLVSGGRR